MKNSAVLIVWTRTFLLSMGNLVAAKLPTASYCRTSVRLLGCKFARCGCSRRRMSSFHQRPPQLSASSWRKWSADCVRALKLCVQQSHNWGKTTEFQFVTSTRREKYRDWLLPGKRDDYLVQQLPFNRVRSLFFPCLGRYHGNRFKNTWKAAIGSFEYSRGYLPWGYSLPNRVYGF